MTFAELRKQYHKRVSSEVLKIIQDDGRSYPNLADPDSRSSVLIATELVALLGYTSNIQASDASANPNLAFRNATIGLLESALSLISLGLIPGTWELAKKYPIKDFDNYQNLAAVEGAISQTYSLESSLGAEVRAFFEDAIKPDIIILRAPIMEATFHLAITEGFPETQSFTPLRAVNNSQGRWILHASISCKWTVRSDRSQNTRTEALNLIRNRKGNLPHVVAITAEPLPTRIASLAFGTGDLDCVYHFALPELREAVTRAHAEDQADTLAGMINSRRLRDISDLPFDLAI